MGFLDDLINGNAQQQGPALPPTPLRNDYVAPEPIPAPSAKPINPAVVKALVQKYPEANIPASDEPAEGPVDEKAPPEPENPKAGLGWLQFAASTGDALAGRSNAQTAQNFDGIRKNIDLNDPNSQKSKAVQNIIKKNWGDQFTDEQISKITAGDADLIYKPMELKSKLDQTAQNQQMLHEDRQLKNEVMRQSLSDKQEAKHSEQDKKDALELDTHLSKGWTGKSGQAGIVQGKIISAEAAEQLIDQAKTQKGGLDSRQIEELAQSTGKLLGGGASASARIEALVPHTMWGRAQSLKEWLTNDPTGAGQEEFVKRMAETVSREKALAEDQKKQFQIEGLPARSGFKKRNPELYNQILQSKGIDESLIDKNGRYKAPAQDRGGSKPQTVVQNGHTYNLNPQTGEYE